MIANLKYVVEGPGELDVACSILRCKGADFTLGVDLIKGRSVIRDCRVKSIRAWGSVFIKEKLRRSPSSVSASILDKVFSVSGDIFEIEGTYLVPSSGYLRFFRAYYSLKTRKGLVISIETNDGLVIFIDGSVTDTH